MDLNVPAGAPETWLHSSPPQHKTVASVRSPQECEPPALTWVNVPGGVVLCPNVSSPQHTGDWSGPMAHAWKAPASTVGSVAALAEDASAPDRASTTAAPSSAR